MATGALTGRCAQGYALRSRISSDEAGVQSIGKLISSIDPDRAPRRFRQARDELIQKRANLSEGRRWLIDHDKTCPTCSNV